jgi:hypothetical protein
MTRRAASLHRSGKMDRSSVQEKLFGERSLACVRVAYDRKRTAAADGFFEHDDVNLMRLQYSIWHAA